MALDRVLHMRMTSARVRQLGATTWLTLAAAADPVWAATLEAASLWSGRNVTLDGAVVIALCVPPIVLITFTAANVLGLWQSPSKTETLRPRILRPRDWPEQTADPVNHAAPEGAQVTSPIVAVFWEMDDRLAAIAGLIGSASGALAAISRGNSPIQAPPSGHSAGGDPGIAAAIRSESAFVLGAAQSLEASIGDAADAVGELAEAISDAAISARSAADVAARTADVAQVAAASQIRLDAAAQQIVEIAAFIDKVSSQTQQATAVTLASVANIIRGAAEARQSIEEASGLIAKLRDPIGAASDGDSRPADGTEHCLPRKLG